MVCLLGFYPQKRNLFMVLLHVCALVLEVLFLEDTPEVERREV